MPATGTRPATDLWLCGHHWRASRWTLAEAGAAVYDVSQPLESRETDREAARA